MWKHFTFDVMQYFIDVILPIPLEHLFTYSITNAESGFLKKGMRVAVPFGKSKIYTALVYNIHQNAPEVYEAKSIHQILDESPLVTEQQIKLWHWIAKYYMCTLGDVLRAAIPSAFLLESETVVSLNNDTKVDDAQLKDDAFLVYEALQYQSTLRIQDIVNILDKKNVLPVLKQMLENKVIKIEEELYEKYKPKLVRYVKLNNDYNSDIGLQNLLEKLSRAPKQKEIVVTYFSLATISKKPIKVSDLVLKSKATSTQIKVLIDKQIFEEFHIQTDRVLYSGEENESLKTLNSNQFDALTKINESFANQNVTLLHGVTSSGKTEIYVKLMESVLEQKKQVLYLVPEIALTTQLVSRLQNYFGEKVIVYHSKYSLNERVEVWNKVLQKSDKSQIILGARSSVLLPFSNLGLIIVDEEHEQSYKQFDPAPRYHARDTAIVLANICKAKTLLGSATPSIESYFNANKREKVWLWRAQFTLQ